MPGVLVGVGRILGPDHLLMDFFARPDPGNLVSGVWRNCLGNVGDGHGWDLFDIDLSALHIFECVPDKFNTLLEGNHKSRHARVGNGQHSCVRQRHEEWDYRSAGAHNIAIAHH